MSSICTEKCWLGVSRSVLCCPLVQNRTCDRKPALEDQNTTETFSNTDQIEDQPRSTYITGIPPASYELREKEIKLKEL